MSNILQDLISLSKQLLPTGRAFRVPVGGRKEKLNKALAYSEQDVYNSAVGVLDSILPDNDNFTAEDATRWEQRLGMIVNESVPLQDRKDAIKRKMNHPGTILARQSAGYIQDQLQAAGFDVYVHENINGFSPQTIIEIGLQAGEMITGTIELGLGGNELNGGNAEMGELEMISMEAFYPDLALTSEMGSAEMGTIEMGQTTFSNIIANYINEDEDQYFQFGQNYLCTFVIGGQVFGTFANVSEIRKDEFRQLILKTKPTQTVGILLINYT